MSKLLVGDIYRSLSALLSSFVYLAEATCPLAVAPYAVSTSNMHEKCIAHKALKIKHETNSITTSAVHKVRKWIKSQHLTALQNQSLHTMWVGECLIKCSSISKFLKSCHSPPSGNLPSAHFPLFAGREISSRWHSWQRRKMPLRFFLAHLPPSLPPDSPASFDHPAVTTPLASALPTRSWALRIAAHTPPAKCFSS